MSQSPEKRRLRKQKKKRQRDAQDRIRTTEIHAKQELQRREKLLPSYTVIEIDPPPPALLEAIPEAWRKVASAKELSDDHVDDLERARRHGFLRTKRGPINWSMHLGELLFRELGSMLEPTALRRCDIEVIATPRSQSHVELRIRKLKSVKSFVACSPHEPKINLPSGEHIVSYSLRDDDHFIRRLEERTVAVPSHYFCKGQIFACLYRWRYFDPIQLPDGRYAARLWNWCDPKLPIGKLWEELLENPVTTTDGSGEKYFESGDGRGYYLVGYCPVNENQLDSGYAILNTLLLPGMGGTPEEAAITKNLDTVGRAQFGKRAAVQTMRNLNLSGDFSVVREYHRHIPQVRYFADPVFEY